VDQAQLVAGNQNWFTRIQGTDVDLPLIRSWLVGQGGFFTPADVTSAAKVCVIGTTVRDMLFGEDDPGKDPHPQPAVQDRRPRRLKGRRWARPGRRGLRALHHRAEVRGITTSITVSAASATRSARSRKRSDPLRTRHKIMQGDSDDFMVHAEDTGCSHRGHLPMTAPRLDRRRVAAGRRICTMNIMPCRSPSAPEIGLRLAIGARGRDVPGTWSSRRPEPLRRLIGIGLGHGLSRVSRTLDWSRSSGDAVAVVRQRPPPSSASTRRGRPRPSTRSRR
jgi:putative ABC transport system permease protein